MEGELLGPDIAQQIQQMMLEKMDAETIAMRLNINIELVINKMQSQEEPQTHQEMLEASLTKVNRLIKVAEDEYDSRSTDRNAMAITSLISTQQSLIIDINKLQDPAVVFEAITHRVVQSIIRDYLKTASMAVNQTQKDLEPQMSPESYRLVQQSTEEMLRSLAARSKESYENHITILAKEVGYKPDLAEVPPLLQQVNNVTAIEKRGS
jgi:hypothetical protein